MADTVRFHDLHGPNVVLAKDKTEATWQLERSGGVLFSEDPLRPGDNVKVTCEGSGRMRVGCSTENPMQYKGDVPDSVYEINGFEVMNEIRFHKRDCSVHVCLNTTGDTITSSCGFLKYDKVVRRKQPVWLALYIMFGEVKVTATRYDDTKVTLSLSHGINVALNDVRTVATSIHQSPGAFCVTGAPLFPGDSIFLRCEPTVDQGHVASIYYVALLISARSPQEISERRGGFCLTDLCVSKPPLSVVETLRKEECKGEVRVSLLKDNRLEYRTANKKVNSQTLWFEPTDGVWVYLELYRTRVAICSQRAEYGRQHSEPYQYVRSELVSRHRSLSARSGGSYQYTHITCGSYGRTLPLTARTGSRVGTEGDRNTYMDMGPLHLSTSCPADLDQGGGDEVDGIRHSLEDLSHHVKKLDRHVDALTNVFVTGTELVPSVSSRSAAAADLDETDGVSSDEIAELAELRISIRRNWIELINCLQTEAMGDLLFQHGVISHPELDKIRRRVKMDGQEANRQILDILIRRGIRKALLNEILDKAGDTHLKELFFKK